MKLLAVLVVAVAGVAASGPSLSYPEIVRGHSRIVSGWEAAPGQIPHQLSLRMVSGTGNVGACGASIIHAQWALTAAHCTGMQESLVVRVGTHNLTTPPLIFETTEYYNHPEYDSDIPQVVQPNDVSLVKFPITLQFNELAQPIRLQRSGDQNKIYDDLQLVASGWGALWTAGASPEVLNWVYLRGVTNEVCSDAFGNSPIIQPSTVCARGYNDTTQSTCQGDSGGPLTILEEDGKVTLIGVASFVSAMGCHAGLPAGFIRPGYYHDWYTEITGVNFDWEPETTTEQASATEEATTVQAFKTA